MISSQIILFISAGCIFWRRYQPLNGMIKASSAPLRKALEFLGR